MNDHLLVFWRLYKMFILFFSVSCSGALLYEPFSISLCVSRSFSRARAHTHAYCTVLWLIPSAAVKARYHTFGLVSLAFK